MSILGVLYIISGLPSSAGTSPVAELYLHGETPRLATIL